MASAVARKVASTPVGALPPASPFAELLRRSRFASYDPAIRQTYSAPQAYAQRGNWGLKRPISQRNKDAYITLKSYEDHAQFIEWNNAGAEVRFVKQFEELNMAPRNTDESIQKPFFDNLGPVQNSIWLTDSEFDEAVDGEYKHSLLEERVEERIPGAFDEIRFDSLGKRGKGEYGKDMEPTTTAPFVKRMAGPWNYRQPNFDAMNESEFQEYLRKLRELRPQFLEEIRQVHTERLSRGELTSTLLDGDVSDLQLAATNCFNDDHRAFLNKFFETQWEERDTTPSAADPVTEEALPADFVKPKIKPQPHRFGGLIYSHPSLLDTFYTTEARPAFALNNSRPARESDRAQDSITPSRNEFTQVSMGGVAAKFEGKLPFYARPLFTATAGPRDDALSSSILTELRPKTISILEAPKVVGRDAEGLHGTSIKEIVVESPTPAAKGWDNAHIPGTYAYNSAITGHMPNVSLSGMGRTVGKGRQSWKQKKATASLGQLMAMVPPSS